MRSIHAFLISAGAAILVHGCGGGDAPFGLGGAKQNENTGDGGSPTGGASGGGGEGGCMLGCYTEGNPIPQKLVITPEHPTVTVIEGNISTQAFKVETQDGVDVTASVTWLYDRPDIGDMVGGAFTPTGGVGGVGKLRAQFQKLTAETSVTVDVTKTVNQAGLNAAQVAAFDAPVGPDPSMALVYPYDRTVFPLGVLAPELQWSGVNAGDVYRLKIQEKHLSYSVYFKAGAPARYLLDQEHWEQITSSGTGSKSDPVTVELSRMSGGEAFQAVQHTWHVAQGKVRGVVYYWELPDACGGNPSGRILKIKPDSPAPEEFFQPGGCWGCHTVSRDGTTMMATLDAFGPFPQVTIDLKENPSTFGAITQAAGLTGTFGAFNGSGDKLVLSNDYVQSPNDGKRLRIVDTATGALLNTNAMGPGCLEPAWSPDGTKLAAICGATGNKWGFDSPTGNLAVADVAPDGVTIDNVKTIVPKGLAVGRPAYPSFTSDSAYIAFGRPTDGARSSASGSIWLVKPDGSELKELSAASSDGKSFNPVFAPQRAGGYYWLVFISRRDYGNTLVNTNRQQLWMTAIDDPPTAGDPSHPPFYMRGQEGCGKSENAYMAPEPCKPKGETCVTGADCCEGQCIKDAAQNDYVCGDPPSPGACSESGNACASKADCCNPMDECIDGFCQPEPPK
jgi:hypothetical protein